jgi:elongation factor P--beta-lysine ligase
MLVVRPVLCCQLAGTTNVLSRFAVTAAVFAFFDDTEFREFDSAALVAVPAVTVEFLFHFAR